MNARICKSLLPSVSLLLLASIGLSPVAHAQGSGLPWVGTWGVAPAAVPLAAPTSSSQLSFSQQTVRQVVHTGIGGSSARIHLSNLFGTAPLTVTDVHIADSTGSLSVNTQTHKLVTFHGSSTVTIPIGQEVLSDPIQYTVPALGDVAISIYFPSTTPILNVTTHVFTEAQNNYVSGDLSGAAAFPADAGATMNYFFLTGLDVQNSSATGTLTALGASITDGYKSTNYVNHRWPNFLAQRFSTAGLTVGVLNEGIAGNQLLRDNNPIYGLSAENRFGGDVLAQPAVRWVIFSDDPINDLGNNPQPTSSDLITGIQSLMTQAHAQQLKFFCSTLTPFQGYPTWNQQAETTREAINTWIRSSSSGCDGVVDQDAALRDPNNPEAYLPAYDSGDHLHPNDAGYQAIANTVDLSLFMQSTPLAPVVPSSACGTLTAGQVIAVGTQLKSCDQRFILTLQSDGNLVLYLSGAPLWNSGTNGKPSAQAVLGVGGNLVIYNTNGQPIWATNSDNNPGAQLVLQNDGNLVLYTPSGQPVWNSATNGH